MKSSRLLIVSLFLLILSGLAIYANTVWLIYEKKPFTIGITQFNTPITLDTKSLEKEFSREILIVYYEDENALLKAIYERQLDGYILNPFNFITHYNALDGAKALASLKVDYYLVSRKGESKAAKSVAIFDDHLSALLINQRTIKQVYLSSPTERLAALSDGLVDLIVIESAYYMPEKHEIIEKASSKGYDFSLFILSSDWLLETLSDEDQQIKHDLQASLFEHSEVHFPDEEKLMRVMNYLFQKEIIEKRIDYSELVFTNGL